MSTVHRIYGNLVKAQQRLKKHRLLILAACLIFAVFCSIYFRPEINLYSEGIYTAPLFYPLLIYTYTPWALVVSLLLAGIFVAIWAWARLDHPNKQQIAIPAILSILVCSCSMGLSASDAELDYFGLIYTLSPHQSLRVQDHMYQLALKSGRFGFYGGVFFECGPFGLICRAIHVHVRGTESGYDPDKAQLKVDGAYVIFVYGDEVLYRHPIRSGSD